MEIDQRRQQLEMTEVIFDVYDFVHPTPVSLQELSAIAVSLEIWRLQVEKYRQSGTLTELRPKKERISLKTALPDLPSKIYETIEAYFMQFGRSLKDWLIYHHARVYFRYEHKNLVLNDFDDFVCDYSGKIDYVRTAERMMSCDRFRVEEKFIIACICFFEDDIRRLWPSVSSKMCLNNTHRESLYLLPVKMNLNRIDFKLCPQLYYWVKCLEPHSGNITIPCKYNQRVEEEMFDQHRCNIRPSLEYFWDRIPLECQVQKAVYLHDRHFMCFISVILPKLDVQQLDEFFKRRGPHLLHTLLKYDRFDEKLVLEIWLRIKNVMNERSFAYLMVAMLEDTTYRRMEDDRGYVAEHYKYNDDDTDTDTEDEDEDENENEEEDGDDDDDDDDDGDDAEDNDSLDEEYNNESEMSVDDEDDDEDDVSSYASDNCKGVSDLLDKAYLPDEEYRKWSSFSHLCREIWNNAPHNLKQSAIKFISADSTWLKEIRVIAYRGSTQINVELLLLILESASFEERTSFWRNCWHLLIAAARGDDLQRIMNLCFENEHQINEFKQNIMASSENIRKLCFELLSTGRHFDYLTELVSFVWPEMQNARNFKQQILRECFFDARPRFERDIIRYHKKFDDFIAGAYESVDLSNDFKNQMISSSAIQDTLWRFIQGRLPVQQGVEFMGTFATAEETLRQVKMNMIGRLKAYVKNNPHERGYLLNRPEIKSMLLWCLGSEKEVEEFKLSCTS